MGDEGNDCQRDAIRERVFALWRGVDDGDIVGVQGAIDCLMKATEQNENAKTQK